MRYYRGDINGGLGSQASDSADRFGVLGRQPNYLEYFYTKDEFDVKELKTLINELNNGLKYISQFIEDNEYYVVKHRVGGYETIKYNKDLLVKGIEVNSDDNLFGTFDIDEIENNLWRYEIFCCFDGNSYRKSKDSNYGMKVEGLTDEHIKIIEKFIIENNLIIKAEEAILGAKIYACVQKNGKCYFTTEF